MKRNEKSDLERILEVATDTEGLPRDVVEAELEEAHGIDLAAAERRLEHFLEARGVETAALDRARMEREAFRPKLLLSEFRVWVRSLAIEGLIDEIRKMEGAFAHRDFDGWSREDLESHLYDLKVLEERASEEGER